ncbi:hypothetical protein GCM10009555_046660 [Acrocarpospora macrocephala]
MYGRGRANWAFAARRVNGSIPSVLVEAAGAVRTEYPSVQVTGLTQAAPLRAVPD